MIKNTMIRGVALALVLALINANAMGFLLRSYDKIIQFSMD